MDDNLSDSDYENFFSPSPHPPPSSYPALDLVQKERDERVNKIFRDWHLLNHIVQRHEALIQKRWLGKNRQQRKTILLSAWPNMPVSHRPDMEIFMNEMLIRTRNQNSNANGTKIDPNSTPFNKDAYFWPHINQEDLLKPKLFLIFLNARARHYPSTFAGTDKESTRFAYLSGKIQPAFLDNYTMMLRGKNRNTPDTYAQLYGWEDHPEALNWLVSKRGDHPGQALWTLEIQERTYDFLLNCCLRILHEMPRESLSMDTSPIEPEPPALSLVGVDGLNSLTAITAMAPFRLPANLDLKRLYDLVEAKKSAQEDHIWSLREDPSYFAEVMVESWDHRQEAIFDTNGKKHSLMRPENRKYLWERVFAVTIEGSYRNLVLWNDLSTLIRRAMTLQETYKDQVRPDEPLPNDFLKALLELEFSLEHYITAPIQILNTIVPASPPLRVFCARVPEELEGNNHIVTLTRKPISDKDKTVARLMLLFQLIWEENGRLICGLPNLLDELDHLVENDPRTNTFISPLVTSAVEDLSLLSECTRQIHLFQPWASTFNMESKKYKEHFKNRFNEQNQLLSGFDIYHNRSVRFSWPVADPSSSQFNYPIDRRRTKDTTETIQQAEHNLDAFWKTVDETLWRNVEASQRGPFSKLLGGDRRLYRTLSWVEPAQTKPLKVNRQTDAKDSLTQTLSQLQLDSESSSQSEPKNKSLTSEPKIKTRGVGITTQSDPSSEPTDDASSSDDIQLTILVDKRSMKVFSMLFYQPSVHDQPGEVPWNDFLHAMINAGFAAEKLYGSEEQIGMDSEVLNEFRHCLRRACVNGVISEREMFKIGWELVQSQCRNAYDRSGLVEASVVVDGLDDYEFIGSNGDIVACLKAQMRCSRAT
ncbi:hypothetical protein BGZ83_010785, partial [Gryganskiella cystojenkinii]